MPAISIDDVSALWPILGSSISQGRSLFFLILLTFNQVQSTETPLRTEHTGAAPFSYGLDTARRYHSGPTASPLGYDAPATISDMMGYRGYYSKHSGDHQGSPYYGIAGPPATWASSMSPTYVDEGHPEVGVDYSTLPTHYTNHMIPLYGTSASAGRWASSKSAGGQVYVTESPYSPVYPPTNATPSSTAEVTTVSRADAYGAQGPFPGMGRMAASLPNPAALVDSSKMGAMLPTPASSTSARTPLPSSPSSYRMPHSSQIPDALQHSSSPIDSSGASQYYEYPAQSSGLASTGTPVSATRSTLPGNGSAMGITSTSTGGTDASLYSSHAATERESDDTYPGSHIFRHDQDLKSQSSSGDLGYTYEPPLAGSGDDGSAPVGYYAPPSVEMTTPVAATAADRDGPRAGLRA